MYQFIVIIDFSIFSKLKYPQKYPQILGLDKKICLDIPFFFSLLI
jgi:hypothetical protein